MTAAPQPDPALTPAQALARCTRHKALLEQRQLLPLVEALLLGPKTANPRAEAEARP